MQSEGFDYNDLLEIFVGAVVVIASAVVFVIGTGWREKSRAQTAGSLVAGFLALIAYGLASKNCFLHPYFIDAYVYGVVLICAALAYAMYRVSKHGDEDLHGGRELCVSAILMSLIAIATVKYEGQFDNIHTLMLWSSAYWGVLLAAIIVYKGGGGHLRKFLPAMVVMTMLAASYTAINFSYRYEPSRQHLIEWYKNNEAPSAPDATEYLDE